MYRYYIGSERQLRRITDLEWVSQSAFSLPLVTAYSLTELAENNETLYIPEVVEVLNDKLHIMPEPDSLYIDD